MKTSLIVAAASVLGLTPILSPMDGARADELRVLAGGSLRSVLTELAPQFERASGHKLIIHFDTTPNLIKAATTGEPFDLGVVPIDVFYDEAAKAHFTPPTEFARVGYGVAVKAGASKPDISTPEAFKKTLLNAKSITFLPASAAGSYILRLFERLGIEEAMRAKTIAQDQPTGIVPAVVNGEAELAVFVNNVLTAPGIDIVGPFPAKYQQELVFPAALAVDTKQKEAAKAFIDFIKSPAATVVVKAKGMTPGRVEG
jgi:molybdate transport system substrate-binding protein